jgi:hypothetical protein
MITYVRTLVPCSFFDRNCPTPRFSFSNSNSRTLFISTYRRGAYHTMSRACLLRERSAARLDPSSKAVGADGVALAQKSTEQVEKDGQKAPTRLTAGKSAWSRRLVTRPIRWHAYVCKINAVRVSIVYYPHVQHSQPSQFIVDEVLPVNC